MVDRYKCLQMYEIYPDVDLEVISVS
jgi:hypothetical protein